MHIYCEMSTIFFKNNSINTKYEFINLFKNFFFFFNSKYAYFNFICEVKCKWVPQIIVVAYEKEYFWGAVITDFYAQ